MSRNYDNCERLVGAAIEKEQFRQMALSSTDTSFNSTQTHVTSFASSDLGDDDDPLPGIENLQISGEAFPGNELQACGYSINGTTGCNFEWVRHLEDGSFNYIDGAKQPNYLITADDIDTYLAVEVQPLDDKKRKGRLYKVFANEHRKITCDPVEKMLENWYEANVLS